MKHIVRQWSRTKRVGIIFVMVSVFAGFLSAPYVAQALSNTGPDTNEFKISNFGMMYALANTDDVTGAGTVQVPIYIKSGTRPSGIKVKITASPVNDPTGSGGALAKPTATFKTNVSGGHQFTPSDSGTYTLPASGFVEDNDIGYWKYILTATLSSAFGTNISFRVQLPNNPSPGGYVGYSSVNSQFFAVAPQARCTTMSFGPNCVYGNYNVPFAPPCNQAGGTASFTIFDGDNDQSTGTDGYNVQPRKFTIRIYDITAGRYVTGSETNPSGYFDNSTNMGNGDTASFNFGFAQEHKYRLVLNNIYVNNVLQFKLPFDSIYSVINCTRNDWQIAGTTAINQTTAVPGDVVTWTHTVKNTGSDKTTLGVTSRSVRSDGWSGTNSPMLVTGGKLGVLRTFTDSRTITTADLGKTFCANVSFNPISVDDSGTGTSAEKCVAVPYSYALTPSITAVSPNPLTVDSTNISVSAVVGKSGSTQSKDVVWQVTRMIVAPGDDISPTTRIVSTTNVACSAFSGHKPGVAGCDTVWDGSRVFTNSSTPIVSGKVDSGVNTASLLPGTKVCYVASVKPNSSSDADWRHSAPVCRTVVQTPFVRILGNDLRVGSALTTGGNKSSLVRGYVLSSVASSAEYGVLAPGAISGIGSMSGAYNGSPAAQSAWDSLTFANTPTDGGFATAAGMGALPNIPSLFATGASYSGTSIYRVGGNVSVCSYLSARGINPNAINASVVIVTTGNAVISCDLKYQPGSISDSAQMPQLVIVAGGNISITDAVARIDAWLVAPSGIVDTCTNKTMAQLTSTTCNAALRINGPIVAEQLSLKRTYYDIAKKNVAETVDLRGDAYVWANKLARQNGSWQTTYTTDLPPRY